MFKVHQHWNTIFYERISDDFKYTDKPITCHNMTCALFCVQCPVYACADIYTACHITERNLWTKWLAVIPLPVVSNTQLEVPSSASFLIFTLI